MSSDKVEMGQEEVDSKIELLKRINACKDRIHKLENNTLSRVTLDLNHGNSFSITDEDFIDFFKKSLHLFSTEKEQSLIKEFNNG